MDCLIKIVFEVDIVFGKVGCVEIVIDFVLFIMIEIIIWFKFKN